MNDRGFVSVESDVWNMENDVDIETVIFNALYAMNEEKFSCRAYEGKEKRTYTARDFVMTKLIGCYFPPKGRVFYKNTLDIVSDNEPEIMTLSGGKGFFHYDFDRGCPDLVTAAFFPLKKAPQGIKLPRNVDRIYKFILWTFYEDGLKCSQLDNVYSEEMSDVNLDISTTYLSVNFQKETVFPCFDERGYSPIRITRKYAREIFYITASAYADRKHLWNVAVQMPVTEYLSCVVVFGVHEDHIKSLLYARSTPITSSGRKRPIQHWVSSHDRRLEKGIDVKVKKHLRGITDFEMYGQNFKIMSPHRAGNSEIELYESRASPLLFRESPRFSECQPVEY